MTQVILTGRAGGKSHAAAVYIDHAIRAKRKVMAISTDPEGLRDELLNIHHWDSLQRESYGEANGGSAHFFGADNPIKFRGLRFLDGVVIDNLDLCRQKWVDQGEWKDAREYISFLGPLVLATMTGDAFDLVDKNSMAQELFKAANLV